MAIFLTSENKVVVQGITGSEATKHTARMLKAGTHIVGGVNARKAGTTVAHKNVDEGRKILADANHPLVIQAETMDAGADKAAELANK